MSIVNWHRKRITTGREIYRANKADNGERRCDTVCSIMRESDMYRTMDVNLPKNECKKYFKENWRDNSQFFFWTLSWIRTNDFILRHFSNPLRQQRLFHFIWFVNKTQKKERKKIHEVKLTVRQMPIDVQMCIQSIPLLYKLHKFGHQY